MKRLASQIIRGLIDLVALFALLVISWVFFGPVAGFHHMIRCGILTPVFLDAEESFPGHLMWGDYYVFFFPGRIAVSLLLWAVCVGLWYKLAKIARRLP
ncbi:MAG TPA: hypothetical protein VFC07_09625 [Verrucomicrobiae bacterium]|nr:hypothetical protein [Verrucomicrobiae bacterium]